MKCFQTIIALFAVVAGLGLIWLFLSARGREVMSIVNVPRVSKAEQDVITKERAAERAEFELAIAEELSEPVSILNALSATARSARTKAVIARTDFEQNEENATEPVRSKH